LHIKGHIQERRQEKAVELGCLRDILKLALQHAFKRDNARGLKVGGKNVLHRGRIYLKSATQAGNLSKTVKLGESLKTTESSHLGSNFKKSVKTAIIVCA